MGTKNKNANTSYDERLTLERFKKRYATIGLSEEGYRYIYEHLSDAEVEQAALSLDSDDEDYNIFHGWEHPLTRTGDRATGLSFEARVAGKPEDLKKYLEQNEEHLSAADMAFLVKHIEEPDRRKKINDEANDKLEKGEKRPEVTTFAVNPDNGFLEVDSRQPAPQSSSLGCWSVALQQLVQCKGGRDVTQEDIRSYRPADVGFETARNMDGDLFKQEVDDIYNKDDTVMAEDMFDAVLEYAPNTMIRSVILGSYNRDLEERLAPMGITREDFKANAVEMIRQTAEKAIYIDHSPLVIRQPGHYLNIVGIKGNTLLVQDPLPSKNPPLRTREEPIEWFVDKLLMSGTSELKLSWASDIRLDKEGKIIGLPDAGVSVNEAGEIQLNPVQRDVNEVKSPSNQKGYWIRHNAGQEDMAPEDKRQPVSAGGLSCANQVYIPKKLNIKALKIEAQNTDEKEIEERKKDAALYFVDSVDMAGLNMQDARKMGPERFAERAGLRKEEEAERIRRQQPDYILEERQRARWETKNQWIQKQEIYRNYAESVFRIRAKAQEELGKAAGMEAEILGLDPDSVFGDLIDGINAVQRLSIQNNAEEIFGALEQLGRAASACIADRDMQNEPGALELARSIEEWTNRVQEEEIFQLGSGLIPGDYKLPILEGLNNATEHVAFNRTMAEADEAGKAADDFATDMKGLVQTATESLKVLESTKSIFGSDSPQYTMMKRGLEAVAGLSVDNSALEVMEAVGDLRIATNTYINKITSGGGGKHGKGVTRLEEAQKIRQILSPLKYNDVQNFIYGEDALAEAEENEEDKIKAIFRRKLPRDFDIQKPLQEQIGLRLDPGREKEAPGDFEVVDVHELPLVQRMSRQEFIRKAQDMGWVYNSLLEERETDRKPDKNDEFWLGKLYDMAAEEQEKYEALKAKNDPVADPKGRPQGELAEIVLENNVWEFKDRNNTLNAITGRWKDTLTDPELKRALDNAMVNNLEDNAMLLRSAEYYRHQRQEEHIADGSPWPVKQFIQPEPKNPNYREEKNEAGEKIPGTFEEVGYYHQINLLYFEKPALKGLGMLDAREEILLERGLGSKKLFNTGEWYGQGPDGSLGNGNVLYGQREIIADQEKLAQTKKALRLMKEKQQAIADRQPDTEVGRFIRKWYGGLAVLSDPDLGSMLEAENTKMYLTYGRSLTSTQPDVVLPVNKQGISLEERIRIATGQSDSQKDLPEDCRKGILTEYGDLMEAIGVEFRVEYERQSMLAEGPWNEDKERQYTGLLKEAHHDSLAALDRLFAVKDLGQYDAILPNSLEHTLGRKKGSVRDIRRMRGHIQGEMQALDRGWKSDELDTLSLVGAIGSELEKKRDELVSNPDVRQEDWDKFELLEKEYRDFKKDVWNKRVSTREDKLEVFDKLVDFMKLAKEEPTAFTENDIGLLDDNRMMERIQRKLYGGERPAIDPNVMEVRDTELQIKRLDREAFMEGRKEARQESEDRIREEINDARDDAAYKGWVGRFNDFAAHAAGTREGIKLAMEADERRSKAGGASVDPVLKERREQAIRQIDAFLEKTAQERVYTPEQCRKSIREFQKALRPLSGDIISLSTLSAWGDAANKNRALTPEEKNYYDKHKAFAPDMYVTTVSEFYNELNIFTTALPEDEGLKAGLKQSADELLALINPLLARGVEKFGEQNVPMEEQEEIRSAINKANALLQQYENSHDLSHMPGQKFALEHQKMLYDSMNGKPDYHRVEGTFAAVAGHCLRSFSDITLIGEKDLAGKTHQQQREIVEAHEKRLEENTAFMDVLREGVTINRMGMEYLAAKKKAEDEGDYFDDGEFRQNLREHILHEAELARKLLNMVNDPGYKEADHPELRNYAKQNINMPRGVKGAFDMANLQVALIDVGMPLEELRQINEDMDLFDRISENADQRETVSPQMRELVSRCKEMQELKTPARVRVIHKEGGDIRNTLRSRIKDIYEFSGEIDEKSLKPEEKEDLDSLKEYYQEYADRQVDKQKQELKKMLEEDPDEFAEALVRHLQENTWIEGKKTIREFMEENLQPDREDGAVAGRKIYSPERLLVIKQMASALENRMMDISLNLSGPDEAHKEALKKELKEVCNLEHQVAETLGAYDGLIDGKTPEKFVEDMRDEIFEERCISEAVKLREKEPGKHAVKRLDEVNTALSKGFDALPEAIREEYKKYVRPSEAIRELESEEWMKKYGLKEYRDQLNDMKKEAAKSLSDLKKSKMVEEDTTGRFRKLQASLEALGALGEDHTPEQILQALEDVQKKAKDCLNKNRGKLRIFGEKAAQRKMDEEMTFSRGILDKGKGWIGTMTPKTAEAGKAAEEKSVLQRALGTIDMKSTLKAQKEKVGELKSRILQEKEHHNVSLNRLIEKEGGKEKKRSVRKKAAEAPVLSTRERAKRDRAKQEKENGGMGKK